MPEIRPKHPQASAIIDRGVLVVTLLLPCLAERFNELHIDLQGGPRSLLLVALPSGVFAFVALRRRQPAQADLLQNPPHPRRADGEVVIALQMHCDLLRPEVLLLTQPLDLLHDLDVG